MLATLKGLDEERAADVLVAATDFLAPAEGLDLAPSDTDAVAPELRASVLDEVRRMLRLRRGDDSVEARGRMLSRLNDELADQMLRPFGAEEVRSRAGLMGHLPVEMYEMRLSRVFRENQRLFGVKRHHIEEALREPGGVDHLAAKSVEPSLSHPLSSLFAKRMGDVEDPFVLLVEARRRGHILEVDSAWRVYLSDVDTTDARRPLDILRDFLRVYGLPFNAGPIHGATLLQNITVATPARKLVFHAGADTFPGGTARPFRLSFLIGSNPNETEIYLAYAIDTGQYTADLKTKHRVDVDIPPIAKAHEATTLTIET